MVAGLTYAEELDLAVAENRRYRAAVDIAIQGLATARDRGFEGASDVIAHVNSALSPKAPASSSPLLWPRFVAWAKSLSRRAPSGLDQLSSHNRKWRQQDALESPVDASTTLG
jgi:hypothetical protein